MSKENKMSKETLQSLNINTLIGNTDQRGTAWHYRVEDQGDEPNHYPGPIPVEDVERRLFDWHAESRPIAVESPGNAETMTHLSESGQPMRWSSVEDKQAICRSDNDHVMGIFSNGYVAHQYNEWLLTTVADILDDDLTISSAGLLRGGAVAWVEVSVPESITTPEGVVFRPNLLATTSFDGSIATTFKRTVTDVVCDNTRDAALHEVGPVFKVKHSRYSRAQLGPAREALAVVHTIADDFASETTRLCETPVSTTQWQQFLAQSVPLRHPGGEDLAGRALAAAVKKRQILNRLYYYDARVAPWNGTAHGVIQAVNTYDHHEATVRGSARPERNMLKTINGSYEKLDRDTLQQLGQVLT